MKARFINYRKIYKGDYPLIGWGVHFTTSFSGKMWDFEWRGYAICFDNRKGSLIDWMLTPKEKQTFIEKHKTTQNHDKRTDH